MWITNLRHLGATTEAKGSCPMSMFRWDVVDPAPGEASRLRITIAPLPDHRVRQTFEESKDGGQTWHAVFNAEHRPH